MRGLLLKDFYSLKKIKNMYLILTGILVVICFMQGLHNFIVLIPILIYSTTITSTFSEDRKVKWDKLAVPAPLHKSEIVKSKYILLLLIIGCGITTGVVLSLPDLIMKKINFNIFLEITFFATAIALCSGSLILSFIYLSSSVIDRIELLTVFSYAISALILVGIGKILGFINEFLKWNKLILAVIIFFIALIVLGISYGISVIEYCKHDIF